MKPGTASAPSPRLLDQVREQIRYRHYSLSTEKRYLYWVKFFIRWHGRGGVMRHPRDMGAPEAQAFLTMLAQMDGITALLAKLLYGTGMRLMGARELWEAERAAQRSGVE